MRLWLAITITILAFAKPTMARNITVRSGEHSSFSRLVFYIKPTDTYSVVRVDDGYQLSVSPDITGFRTAQVFDLIPRTRIDELIPVGNGEILIREACSCDISEFRLPSGELVVDIADGTNPDDGPEPQTRPIQSTQAGQTTKVRDLLPLLGSRDDLLGTEKPNGNHASDPRPNPQPVKTELKVVDKQRLLAQLSKAAAEGLIEANINQPNAADTITAPELKPDETAPKPIPHSPNDHLRIQTAQDQVHAEDAAQSIASQACLPDDQFDITSWGQISQSSSLQTGYSQSYLGEFDRPNKTLLLEHIRQNIFMTFGLEALQLIESYDGAIADIASLRMMAEVMEYGHSNNADRWLTQIGCTTRSALWAVLAQRTLPSDVNESALLRSFSELPAHLRNHLAPALARKFLNAGETETAIEIRNIAARSGKPPMEQDAQLEAEIKLSTGRSKEAESDLATAVQNRLSQTQPTITTLIRSKLNNDRGISDNELTLLSSVAFEHGDSPIGSELQLLLIRTLFHMGRFAQGFDQFDKASSHLKQAQLNATLDEAGQKLLSIGSDAEFLTYSMTRNDWERVSAETSLAMAQRLMQLGFAENARRLVLTNPRAPDRAAREFLAAVAMQQKKPDVALGYLAGLETENAEALRQQALSLRSIEELKHQGDTAPALAFLEKVDAKTALDMLNTPSGTISDTVTAALSEPNQSFELDKQSDLQSYQAILDSSKSTRDALGNLLDLFPTLNNSE